MTPTNPPVSTAFFHQNHGNHSSLRGFNDSHIPNPSNQSDATNHIINFYDNGDDDSELAHLPSLWELNSEIDDWGDINVEAMIDDQAPLPASTLPSFSFTMTPTPTAPILSSRIVSSTSRLFFIS